jgi:lactoylglutathione lyase
MLCAWFQDAVAQSNPEIATSLNHIGMYVSDLEKSTVFYEKVLNLKQIPEPFRDGKHAWFTLGTAGQLHLIMAEKMEFSRHKNDHLCFSIKSMEAFIAHLGKHRVDYTNWLGAPKETTVRPDGVKQIYVKDPDGHLIEINNDVSVR